MGTYNIHAGHCPSSGGACGAVGILNESDEARKVKNRVVSALKNGGNTVYDCTDDSNCSVNQNLGNIVAKCNAHLVDLDVSIHLNSGRNDYGGDNSTGGVEVWCYDGKTADVAAKICENISNALGVRNRGVKYSQSLYVLRRTVSPALLVECCFVDDADDAEQWNADKCGDAIASGIVGATVQGTTASKPSKPTQNKPSSNASSSNWIAQLQSECNKQGFSNQTVDGIAGPNTLSGCPTMRKGARGNIIRIMQNRLISLGYSCGSCGADGIFGAGTYDAVVNFQRTKGLSADGIVGRNTWRALLGL